MANDPNYAYDFSAFQQAAASGASPGGGMSFMGGAPAGAMGGAPGGGAGGAPAGAAGGAPASGGQGSSLSSLLGQSPFGPLLNLPGVTAENLFSNVNPANYGGGNPFASIGASGGSSAAYGGNPFANLGQSTSAMFTSYPGAGSSTSPSSPGSSSGASSLFSSFGA